MGGLDEVALTLESEGAIEAYEQRLARQKPWLARGTALAA
jgi:hypothetical protein